MLSPPPSKTAFELHLDDEAGIIRIVGRGVWSTAQIYHHFVALERLIVRTRAAGRPIRVLVDLRSSPVQPATTASRIRHWTARLYEVDDKVAMLVASEDLRTQMAGVAHNAQRGLFTDEGEACRWLVADLAASVAG